MNSFYRSIFARSLMTGAASLVFMVAGAAGVCAQTVIGANGEDGADCFTDFCTGGNGTEGDSVTAEGTAIETLMSATALISMVPAAMGATGDRRARLALLLAEPGEPPGISSIMDLAVWAEMVATP